MVKELYGIREIAREELIENVFRRVQKQIQDERKETATSEIQQFVLIVDVYSLRILCSLIELNDLQQYGVSIVEQIHLKREPLPSMHAVYFLTPMETSVFRFCKESHTQYLKLHLFFTSHLSESLLLHIKTIDALLMR